MKKLTAVSTNGDFKMKKIAFLLVLILMLSIAVSAAETGNVHSGYGTYLYVSDIGEFCFMENEYYSLFADEYFEEQYSEYNDDYEKWVRRSDSGNSWDRMYVSSDGIIKASYPFVENILNNDGLWYLTVMFNYNKDFSEEKNRQLADRLSDNAEVLYCGNTTPCAVVAVNGKTNVITDILENENVSFVLTAFERYEGTVVNCMEFREAYTPTASDARKILRYSAGLDKAPDNRSEAKKFFLFSDTDYDGKLTASDARKALRIAAGLEKGHEFGFNSSGCGAWWQY
ncbi:MAG: hypothetical protein IKV76_05030 [Clostridia bacterium]|nr:hypothetical protein [Clostridia bacterium]